MGKSLEHCLAHRRGPVSGRGVSQLLPGPALTLSFAAEHPDHEQTPYLTSPSTSGNPDQTPTERDQHPGQRSQATPSSFGRYVNLGLCHVYPSATPIASS